MNDGLVSSLSGCDTLKLDVRVTHAGLNIGSAVLTSKSGPAYATEHVSSLDVILLRTKLTNMRHWLRQFQFLLYPVPSDRYLARITNHYF